MRWRSGVVCGSFVLGVSFSDAIASGLDELLAALASDPSPRVRAQAALALGARAGAPEVEVALVAALYDGDGIVRAAAAKALSETASPQAFHDLCWAAVDPDPLVAKWAGLAVRRVIARSGAVRLDVHDLVSRTGYDNDLSTKTFQEVVLERLVRDPRYDVGTDMDFRDGGRPQGQPVVALRITGVAWLDAMEFDPERPADPPMAEVRVTIRVLAPSGFVVLAVEATGRGRTRTPAPDPDADEYSLPAVNVDGRLVALRRAAEAAADELAARLASGQAEDPVGADGAHSRSRSGASGPR